MSAVEYKINTALTKDVIEHLTKCKDNFEPSLDKTVNIAEYSAKIVAISTTFEAWDFESLVGLIAVYLNDEKNKSGFITNVSTVSDYFGHGIAKKLLNNALEYAKEKGFLQISLEVNKNNTKAVNLYKNFNFIVISETPENYIMKSGLGNYYESEKRL